MNLTPDSTLFIQVLLFLVVWAGLSRLAFAPTREVLEQRTRRTVAAQQEAVAMVASADADRDSYDATVQERRQQLAANTATARATAQQESSRALDAAREAANQALATRREAVVRQIESARGTLGATADDIARQMLDRVSGSAAR